MSKIIPVVFMFAIMLTGATIIGLPDAFASGQGKGNDSNKGKDGHGQKGCETAKEASKGKTMNPHCGLDLCELKAEIDINGDGIMQRGEIISFIRSIGDGNRVLTLEEWTSIGGTEEQFDDIDTIRGGNDIITPRELQRYLNNLDCN